MTIGSKIELAIAPNKAGEVDQNNQETNNILDQRWAEASLDSKYFDMLSDHRFIRLDNALQKPPVFVYVLIFGLLVTMACFGAYRPQAPLIVLVTLYTVFVGLVLYLVLAFSDPFQGDLGVAPASFEYLVETLQSEII